MSVGELDTSPLPFGELALQTIAMPKDTNANGDIFGGWLLSQMDLAGSITCLLYTSPSPRDRQKSRMPSSA